MNTDNSTLFNPEQHLEGLTDKERCQVLAYASTQLIKTVNLSKNNPYASTMAMNVVSLKSLPEHLQQKAKDYLQDFIALTFLEQSQELLK